MSTTTPSGLGPTDRDADLPICLVVEDQKEVRHLMALVVRRAGFEVLEAGAVGEVRSLLTDLARGALALSIVDLTLPDAAGESLCPVLRAHSPRAPIILTSGHGLAALEAVARHHENTHVLPKPFVPSVLRDRIRELLAKDEGSAEA